MNRFLAKVVTCWIPERMRRQQVRRRLTEEHDLRHADFHGDGNEVVECPTTVAVRICGSGNRVVFADRKMRVTGIITIGTPDCPVSGCSFSLGAGTTCEQVTVWMLESGSVVSIGRDCMISGGVQIWCSDTHAILDLDGRLLNGGSHTVTVGDHCWIGGGVMLLKNTRIPNDSIVGLGAVVAGHRFAQDHVVIAGNPAKIVRQGISWNRARPDRYGVCMTLCSA